ncbi:pimeloyl-ACP methyl ester carboxylesterase [Microbacterium keratanolyticum]|uniref:Secretory lipase n=1 Tax=Microbacterium keratanolyticum TaxID=67574 RepID=A0A9W6HP89_9MICO|nr:alpha/beta fold hydrolase [Microbacterium keratanolyticum]MBM7468343.1 pimeloyl-ACP methyl ester carboxylesterase [Microbacterium keratanolyticum]GLK00416.1 hypothetical protein GCM10017596_01310 [Microbacterium keratanolyticum]
MNEMAESPAQKPRAHPRLRRTFLIIACALVALVGILAVAFGPRLFGDQLDQKALAEFYDAPAEVAGEPGSIVRIEPLQGHPFDAMAWRILYRTTDVNGAPQLASGVVITPNGDAPDGGRTVLAWGHPTTGSARDCAPSRGFDPFLDIEGLRMLLDRGYTVVATDYVGMGVAGPDSYLVGDTAAHSMLDAVRAARAIEEADAGASVVLWGHSQGGQAALFAAEYAPTYAPELRIDAVAVAAPAAELGSLMQAHLDDVSGATIGSYAFRSYADVYRDRGADLATILTPGAREILPEMNALCLLSDLDELHKIAEPVVGKFFLSDPTTTEPWATLLRENSAGALTFDAPLFVAQGLKDQLVVPDSTKQFAQAQREHGMDVTYHPIALADHGTVAYLALIALEEWLDAQGV